MFRIFFLGCWTFSLSLAGTPSLPDAKPWMEKLQASYDQIQTLQANFHQVYKSFRFGEKISEGVVQISKPKKMRWDYTLPKGRVLTSDGTSVTLYDPEDRQALVYSLTQEDSFPLALSFLFGQGRLSETFEGKIHQQKDTQILLRCTPKKPEPNVREIWLTMDQQKVPGKTPWLVSSVKVVDELGGENEIQFSSFQINPRFSSSLFRFQPPRGAQVVPMNSLQPNF